MTHTRVPASNVAASLTAAAPAARRALRAPWGRAPRRRRCRSRPPRGRRTAAPAVANRGRRRAARPARAARTRARARRARCAVPRRATWFAPALASASATVRACRGPRRSGRHAFTTTPASSSPSASRSLRRSASVSVTGISSGRATASTAVCAGSRSVASIVRPWCAIGPTRAISANVAGVRSAPSACPVAGASTITRSYGCAPGTRRRSWASSHTFPIVSSSRIPGVACANVWKAREAASRSPTRPAR